MRGLKPSNIVTGTSPVSKPPSPPSYLSKDAKAEWRRVAPILVNERKVLTVADLATLENYCIAVATMRRASREQDATGLVVAGKRNPISTILLQAQQQHLRAAEHLGLTPSARSRAAMIADNDDEEENPLLVGRGR